MVVRPGISRPDHRWFQGECADRVLLVGISPDSRPAIAQWLSPVAQARRRVRAPSTPAQRRMSVDTLLSYDTTVSSLTPTVPRAGPCR